MNEKQSLLELIHLTKKFPGVIAVNDFSLNLSTGKVHGLIGENGSGKSTLIKMISGAYRPDEGKIIVDGEEHLYMTPKISRQHGIEVIYQEFNLIEGLSVAENVCFGEETGKLVKFSELRNKTKNIFEFMNVNVNPDALVQDLPVAQKQLVEIAKAISKQARLIIMDEPTAPLTVTEVDSLFSIIRRLKDQGVTIIFVSHRIEELFEITDEITIMRDGLFVDTLNSKECDRHTLINLMVGRELSEE